jgi:hypothetical protein
MSPAPFVIHCTGLILTLEEFRLLLLQETTAETKQQHSLDGKRAQPCMHNLLTTKHRQNSLKYQKLYYRSV